MSGEFVEHKAALRQLLRAEAAKFSAADRSRASERIQDRLRQQPLWQQAAAVLFYAPLPDEPDVFPLMTQALTGGKIVTLPGYSPTRQCYEARRISDGEADLRLGAFGIREPAEACPVFDLNRLDFVLVPGVGFTFSGLRLGRGKGFYDRLLASVRGWKCGVGFDWQMIAALPAEPHDVGLNCILTPTRWHPVVRQSPV